MTEQAIQEQPKIRGYDVPSFEGMSSDEAKAARNKVFADAAGDEHHPYKDKNHFQNKEMKAAIERSFEITSVVSKTEQICNEALAEGAQKKLKEAKAAYDSACQDRDAYERAGGGHLEVPGDIQPGQAKCLKMLRLCQEGKLNELTSMMQSSGRELNISAATMQSYIEITQSENFSKEMKQNFIENILAEMSVQYKKMSAPKPKKRKIDKRPPHLKKTGYMSQKEWDNLAVGA